MLFSYLKIALRSFYRHKGYTFINIVGLAVGMAAFLLILFFVQDERSYDRFHRDADRVFRITQEHFNEQGEPTVHSVMLDPPVAPLLKADFPEVTHAARMTPVGPLLSYGDQHISAGACYWTDPDVFEVFTFAVRSGNPAAAFDEPFTLALSATKAEALFGEAEAVGQTVLVNSETPFTVVGVFEDLPANTHLSIDVLGSITTLERWFGAPLAWDSPNYLTYVRLAEEADAAAFAAKLPGFWEKHRGAEAAAQTQLHAQPLLDIHLHSHLVGEIKPNGDIRNVYLFSAVAVLILLMACINFMNLATAHATRRAKEIGVRKATGAQRSTLIAQFLGEALFLSFLSLMLAVMLVELALPFFNSFTGKSLSFATGSSLGYLLLFIGVGTVVGVLSGGYPAFYLASFAPSVVLKTARVRSGSRASLRAALVVTQFVIAMVLLVGTLVVYRQLDFVQDKPLGYDPAHTLALPTIWDLKEDFDPVRNQLLQNPAIRGVAQSNPLPGRPLHFTMEAQAPIADQARTASLYTVFADEHFFPTYGAAFAAGGNFAMTPPREEEKGFILNERAVAAMGWPTPKAAVGAPFQVGNWRGTVVGVVEDFHFESLHQAIAPMVFFRDPRNYRGVAVKFHAGTEITPLLAFVQDTWAQYEPDSELSYGFLDQRLQSSYVAERKLGQLFGVFALLAVLITCLGLLGIVSYAIEQRTKEIGVRKVLGASVPSLLALLTRDVLTLVLIAFVLAMPLAWFFATRWLGGFAYHASLAWWLFAGAGLAAVLIAVGTVGYKTLRAALADPVRSLRYE